MLLVMMASEAW